MTNIEGGLSGSPLKGPAIEIVDLLSDAEDAEDEPTATGEHAQEEDTSSDDIRDEEWSMYEDALEGAMDDDTVDDST